MSFYVNKLFRIPLSLVLFLQVLVVAAAFVAVIVVLSEQQRKEFEDALTKQLSLQRITSLQTVASPILQRKETFNSYVNHYIRGHLNDKVFAAPNDIPGNGDLDRMAPFYNQFYGFTVSDPMVRQVYVANQSLNSYPGYAVGGDKYKPGYHNTDNSLNTIWNVWTVDSQKSAVVQNESALACIGSFPLRFNACMLKMNLYYNTGVGLGIPRQYNRTGGRRFGSPGMLTDPTVPGGLAHVYTYSYNIDIMAVPYLIFAISFSLDSVKPLVVSSVSAPTSKSALFSQHEQFRLNSTDYYLIAGKFDFTDYDVKTFIASGQDYMQSAWRGGRTPDPILNEVFSIAELMLPNQTGSQAFDFSIGGKKYVGSMGRLVDSTSAMNWLLVEYTPREEFYATSDKARLTGILIGVFGGLLVLVTCIVIWVAIRQPLLQLREGMALAAEMRNDEVEHIYPILSEISDLGLAFRQMNAKLLAARPFLPQSLLRAGDTTQEEDNDEGEGNDHVNESRISSDTDATGKPSSRFGTTATRTSYSSKADTTKAFSLARGGRAVGLNSFHREPEVRRVSVLSLNVIGFHQGVGGLQNAAALLRAHKALARIVEVSAGEERGIVDYFHGDHFVCGFNTSRLCGNSARSGAEAATKISERFLADSELVQAFPLGLAMGLGVGKAVVGNHGTDTMQRQVTMGKVYGNSARLQEVMSRRILFGQGSAVNQHPASRCLLMGRAVQDLQTCNIHCQILGGVPADLFVPASEAHGDPKGLNSMANALNLAIMRPKVDEVQKYSDTKTSLKTESINPSVLVACLAAKGLTGNAADEWLYEMDKSLRSNPYAATNEALYKLWTDGEVVASAVLVATLAVSLPQSIQDWTNHVVELLSRSPCDGEADEMARRSLTYGN